MMKIREEGMERKTMSEEMEIQKRINELVEEKTRRELAERTPEEKEKDEKFLAEFYEFMSCQNPCCKTE